MDEMRALTIRQPWASAIAFGDKRVENRSRWVGYRGLLALHAGLGIEWDAPGMAWTAAGLTPYRDTGPRDAWRSSLALGAVVAVAELTDCHPDWTCIKRTAPPEFTPCWKWSADGQFHWLLGSVRPLAKPVPCKGALGLWRLPADTERAVREQLESVGAAS